MGNPVVHFEVIGGDGPALEKFYGELFGWHIQSMPEMGYGLVDTHAGSGINGGVGVGPQDGTSYVTFYVEVPDLQKALDKIASLGGTTVVPATEVPGVVTFAQFTDPAGNMVGLVKSAEGDQAPGVSPGEGIDVSWFEVLGPNPATLRDFYTQAFDWHATGDEKADFVYFEVDTHAGSGINGGIGRSPDGKPHVNVYAQVDDVQKFLERAESLGGGIAMQPMKMETVEFGLLTDPTGNTFGLYKSLR